MPEQLERGFGIGATDYKIGDSDEDEDDDDDGDDCKRCAGSG